MHRVHSYYLSYGLAFPLLAGPGRVILAAAVTAGGALVLSSDLLIISVGAIAPCTGRAYLLTSDIICYYNNNNS